jgi:NTE family protein
MSSRAGEFMSAKIGLVLGGGGSRGAAHIGVAEVLQRERIPIDLIVGTSMGAIVGALYALDVPPQEMARSISNWQGSNIFAINLFSARARQKQISRELAYFLGEKTFDDLRIPVAMMAVDMNTGREVVLDSGPLLPAVLASSAVPAVFPPVEMDGMKLADGGVIDSLNTEVAFVRGADRVIAVDVYPQLEPDKWNDPLGAIMGLEVPLLSGGAEPGMVSSLWRSVRIAMWYIHAKRIALHPPDVLLRPDVGRYGSLDFNDIAGPLRAGQDEAEKNLPKIRALVDQRSGAKAEGR